MFVYCWTHEQALVNGIRTITLDLDDTLWDLRPVMKRAERRLYDWLGENYPAITAMFPIEEMRILRKQVLEKHADKVHDLTFLRQTVLTEAATAAGYKVFAVDEAFAVFDEVRNDIEMFPESRPALEALAERFTLIAVTNGNANLAMIGIDDLFDGHVNAAMAGAAKPARPIFDAAVEVGGSSRAETVHVGDHPLYDVQGARAAGLRAVWVNRHEAEWPTEYELPDAEVQNVGELVALFAGTD
ncbi:MAG: HAD family hydrolase [Woeseiaceae bacterium]|nr:HAD family hydrolase [Woeseiaceae bacterium]